MPNADPRKKVERHALKDGFNATQGEGFLDKMPKQETKVGNKKRQDNRLLPGFARMLVEQGVSKAVQFFITNVDGRTIRARRVRAMYLGFIDDLGGPQNVSVAESQVLKSCAVLSVLQEDLATMWLREDKDPHWSWDTWLQSLTLVINTLVRSLSRVGMKRRPRNITGTQALQEYIASATEYHEIDSTEDDDTAPEGDSDED